MPSQRTRRERATRTRQRVSSGHSPKVDAYGTVRVLDNEYKARIIDFQAGRLALFRVEAPTAPITLELTSPIQVKGRLMKTTFLAEGEEEVELVFQKAGCGCETPRTLRGGRNALIEGAGLTTETADA